MKKIYQNYNSVYLLEENGEKFIVKRFEREFNWENETKVIEFLRSLGFPTPRIVNFSYCCNKYSFFDSRTFAKAIEEDEKRVFVLFDLLKEFSNLKDKDLVFFSSEERKYKLSKIAEDLMKEKKITSHLFEKIKRISFSYEPLYRGFVHGDFRLENLFFDNDRIDGIIDLEFSGIDDPNKDLAYLWVDTVRRKKDLNHPLKERFKSLDFFDESSFLFWLVYMHVMIISNPFNFFKDKWVKNLEKILDEI